MTVLRSVKGIELNEGDGMARGLYNLSKGDDVTNWFDTDTKDELLELSDAEFINFFNTNK